jgi:hypothetical protein
MLLVVQVHDIFLFIIFESVMILCKFNVSFFKIIIIQIITIFFFYIFILSCILTYKFSWHIIYILPHLCVAKNFWSSKILDQFWDSLNLLNFTKSTYLRVWMFFLMWLIGLYLLKSFPIKCDLLYDFFW